MSARRRPDGPLARFARRSPLHAAGAWLVRAALTAMLLLAVYLFIVSVAAPMLVDGFLEQMRTP